jgi:hypothetical protein
MPVLFLLLALGGAVLFDPINPLIQGRVAGKYVVLSAAFDSLIH